jgi:hypothetical protein
MATILEGIYNEIKVINGVAPLMQPVNPKQVPDYHTIIKNPMDLLQVRNRIAANKYELRSQFISDLNLIYENSMTYNGPGHPITEASKHVDLLGLIFIQIHLLSAL